MIGFFTGTYGALSETFVTKELDLLNKSGLKVKGICFRSIDSSSSGEVLEKDFLGMINARFFLIYLTVFGLKDSLYLALRFRSLCTILRDKHISHLHAHWENQIKLGYIARRLNLIKSYSISWHASDLLEFGAGREKVIDACDHNFVCNRHSFDYLKSFTRNCSLVYHGLDTKRLDNYKVSREMRGDYFVFLGRLIESKGISLIIRAFEKNGLKLRVIGPGDSFKSTSNVQFMGPLEHMSAIKILANSQGLVFGGNAQQGRGGYGLPNVILEACQLDVPVFCRELNEYDVVDKDSVNIWKDINTLNVLLQSRNYAFPRIKRVLNQEVTNVVLTKYLKEK